MSSTASKTHASKASSASTSGPAVRSTVKKVSKKTATAAVPETAETTVTETAETTVSDTAADTTTPETADADTTTSDASETSGGSDKNNSLVLSKTIVDSINEVVEHLKTEAANAKIRKDRDAAKQLADAVKRLNSLRKPIEKLARLKPPRRQISVNASTNGFLRPVNISPELAKFLGCPEDNMMNRGEVTKAISKYITEHSLLNPSNGREVVLDDSLARLLRIDQSSCSIIPYCQIQRHIQPHFMKTAAVVV